MGMRFIVFMFLVSAISLIGAGPAWSVPPDGVSVPEHVREGQASKDQVRDKDALHEQEMENSSGDLEGTPNTSQIHRVGRAGNSNIGHMYLFQKDPDTFEIVDDGAWGKMRYTVQGPFFDFVFNGHGLEPGIEYTLLYYPDPWPGDGLICLGQDTVNQEGDIHIMGSPDIGSIPIEDDENDGAKIWLVQSSDVECDTEMLAWNPDSYLFEYDQITYTDTDELGEDVVFTGRTRTNEAPPAGKTPPVVRSDLDIFIPEAWLSDQAMSFKLEYWENPNDKDGIYFKLDKDSLTLE